MATLNEMIAQGAQFNIPDPVAQYNKLTQMQQYQSQNELNRQEALDKATERQRLVSDRARRATFLTGLSTKLAEKGHTLNRDTLASMLSSGIPDIEKLGFEALKAMQFDESYNTAMDGGGGGAANAPAPAPMAAATPIPTSGVSPSNIGAETFVSTGVGATNFNGTATKFNPTTGKIEPVPLRENQAAAGLFDTKTQTYSPVFGTLALTAPQILTRLNNKLAALTNNPPEGMTPQMRAEMIAATKEEIIATAAGKRDMFTPTNEMAPQAPAAAAVTNAMAPAPTPIPTAAPAGELERLIAQRSKLSRIRPENPGDIAKLKNTLEGIDKQIEVLNRQDPDAVRLAHSIAATVAKRGTPEYQTAYNKALKEQTDKSKAEIVKVIGVATGTKNPVYFDVNTDEQYTYVTGADGKQKRKLYSGGVDRSTSNVSQSVSNSTEKTYGGKLADKLADRDDVKLGAAEKAPQLADSANRIISLVSQGNLFTGPIAGIKLNIARALNVAGASNEEKISNTESLIAATGQSTLDAIKSAGLGTGQGFTDKDLKFLQQIAGGTFELTPQTLTRLATLQHQAAVRSVEAWNTRFTQIPSSATGALGLSTVPKIPPLAGAKTTHPPDIQAIIDAQKGK